MKPGLLLSFFPGDSPGIDAKDIDSAVNLSNPSKTGMTVLNVKVLWF